MVFFELRWNYSPLKEEAVLLPDGLFIIFCRSAPDRYSFSCSVAEFLLLMPAALRPRASRRFFLSLRSTPLNDFQNGIILLRLR